MLWYNSAACSPLRPLPLLLLLLLPLLFLPATFTYMLPCRSLLPHSIAPRRAACWLNRLNPQGRGFGWRGVRRRPVMTGMSDKQDNDEMGREMDLDEDWRSFRAKLVWSESEAGAPRNDAETSSDVRMQEGSLWLHQLPIPEKGCLMLANPTQFGDSQSYFSQSIIVLIEYGVLGTVGFINNRPTPHLVGEVKLVDLFLFLVRFALVRSNDLEMQFAQTHRVFLHCPLFFGGPVGETVQVLHRVGKVKGAKMIVPGLFHGGDLDHAGSLVESGEAKLEDFRFFYKHSSWGPGQLEDEVTQEVWFPAACSTGMIFRPTSIAHAHTHTDKSQWHFCMHKFVTQWMTVLSADEARPECGAVLIARGLLASFLEHPPGSLRESVNSPRHFLVQIRTKGREGSLSGALYQYIDPFNGGKVPEHIAHRSLISPFSAPLTRGSTGQIFYGYTGDCSWTNSPEQLRRSLLSPAPAASFHTYALHMLTPYKAKDLLAHAEEPCDRQHTQGRAWQVSSYSRVDAEQGLEDDAVLFRYLCLDI
eukprot:768408-Hanusia_phi.AAC.4